MLEVWVDWARSKWQQHAAKLAFWNRIQPRWKYVITGLLLSVVVGVTIWRRELRAVLVQGFWCYYLLLQFVVLARTRTVSWQTVTKIFLAGMWIISPVTILVQRAFLIFSHSPSSVWNAAVIGPILEETLKVAPLLLLLALPRRRQMLTVADYALIGAASGMGFQMIEESMRNVRPSFSLSSVLDDLLGRGPQGYHLDRWFSGEWVDKVVFPGHAVLAAGVAVAIGLAVHLRRRWPRIWILPAIMGAWAILDHGVYNAAKVPQWLLTGLKSIQDGRGFLHLTVILFGCAVVVDYVTMRQVLGRVPLLAEEAGAISPWAEHWLPIRAALRRKWLAAYLSPRWLRERRRLAMLTLITEASDNPPLEMKPVRRRLLRWTPIVTVGLSLFLLGAQATGDHAHIIEWFNRTMQWWHNLPTGTKVLLVTGLVAATALAVFALPALLEETVALLLGPELLAEEAAGEALIGSTEAIEFAEGRVLTLEENVWLKGPVVRGREIEAAMDLPGWISKPGNFPVIDAYDQGIATSIKSLDITAESYASDVGAIERALGRYLDKLANFEGELTWGGREVGEVTGKVLNVAIPDTVLSAEQVAALNGLKQAAADKGIDLIFTVIRHVVP